MFEKNNYHIRKWQCFVCGVNHDDYDEFKDHIMEKHDEGREFLICPDCKAPVRDLKSHYKAKHPKRVMPSGLQTRVTIWKDFKTNKDGKKKAVTRGPNFRQGDFVSNKCGCHFPYKSGLECDFFECLESDLDVVGWTYEELKIPYFWKNEWHNYIPDAKVKFIDGSIQIWEIKPANQTQYEQNKTKWAAANNFCTNMGWEFIVLTEVGLGKLQSKIKRQQALNDHSS